MKKAYYARPISIDGTNQETRDHDLIRSLGFEPWPIGQEKKVILKDYPSIGMEVFKKPVMDSDCLIFRSFTDGSIGAGVVKEINWAIEAGIPIIEIPRQINRRELSVDDTRAMLCELGAR